MAQTSLPENLSHQAQGPMSIWRPWWTQLCWTWFCRSGRWRPVRV